MNKNDRLIDASEHPDRYTDEQLRELLDDASAADDLELMGLLRASRTPQPDIDIDKEWERFADSRLAPRRPLVLRIFPSRKVAAIVIGTVASAAAIAAGLVIGSRHNQSEASAPIDIIAPTTNVTAPDEPTDTTAEASAENGTVVFKEESLATIISQIGAHHGVATVVRSESAGRLRLYFKWEKDMPLSEVVSLLDNFEQVDIKTENDTIFID